VECVTLPGFCGVSTDDIVTSAAEAESLCALWLASCCVTPRAEVPSVPLFNVRLPLTTVGQRRSKFIPNCSEYRRSESS